MTTPTLETERFTLRPIGPEDVAALYPTFADDGAMRWWSRGPFDSEDELAGWLLDPTWDGRTWVPVEKSAPDADRAPGPAVGRFVAIPRGEGVAEVGYLVAIDRQGEGIARECLAAVIGQLFAEGHRRVYADVDPDNAASNRLVERLGFTCEGRLRAAWHTHIGVRDTLIWGLLKDEWPG